MDAIYCAHKDNLKENLIPLASELHIAIFRNWYIHFLKKVPFKFEEMGKQGAGCRACSEVSLKSHTITSYWKCAPGTLRVPKSKSFEERF